MPPTIAEFLRCAEGSVDADGGAGLIQRNPSLFPGTFGTGRENFLHGFGMGGEFGAAFAEGGEGFVEQAQQFFLCRSVAIAAGAEILCHFLRLFGCGEKLVDFVDIVGFGVFRGLERGAVGDDSHDRLFDFGGASGDLDRVAVGLAHFLSVCSGDDGNGFRDIGLRNFEGFAEFQVEFRGDIACDFKMLSLVLSDGHEIGLVEQDVGGHQNGVGEEGMGRFFSVGELVFVGVCQLEPRDRLYDAKEPGQFLDFRDIALAEEDGFFRIETEGEKIKGHIHRVLAQKGCICNGGEGMIVRDENIGFALLLKLDALLHHAEVVAEMKLSGRLYARENTHKRSPYIQKRR